MDSTGEPVVLRTRLWFRLLFVVLAVGTLVSLVVAVLGEDWSLCTVYAVLLVVFVAGYRWVARMRVEVAPDAVRVLAGRRTTREVRFADLTRVHATFGRPGLLSRVSHGVYLEGTSPHGHPVRIAVASFLEDVAPAFRVLDPVLAERPELVHAGDRDRYAEVRAHVLGRAADRS